MKISICQMAIVSALFVAFGTAPATADTIVRGGDIGNEVWTVDGSPYIVVESIRVVSGKTLVIEAGVRVQFEREDGGRIGLQVDGSLEVVGAPHAPVTLTSSTPTPGSWSGITFTSATGHLRLDHVTLDYPTTGVSFGGSPTAHLSSTGLTVRHAAVAGVTITDAIVKLDRFTSIDSVRASYNLGASVTFTNCVVMGGPNAEIGIEVLVGDWAPTGSHALRLINCTLNGLAKHGVRAGAYDPGASVTLEVRNTIVSRMGNGGVGAVEQYGGTVAATVEHSNIWGNGSDYVGSAAPGTGTISQEPGFTSATDLRLAEGSPCIDAGSDSVAPSEDLDGASRPTDGDTTVGAFADMGAYERPGAPPACGNGVPESGEACDSGLDNGKYDECNTACDGPGPHCGDASANGPEACDDGNTSDGDGCLTTCIAAACGDEVVQIGVEACDDGNADDGDGCLATCVAAACGDGVIHAGVEACDDGNVTGGDGCGGSCAIEVDDTDPTPGDPPDRGGCRAGGASPISSLLVLLLALITTPCRRGRGSGRPGRRTRPCGPGGRST